MAVIRKIADLLGMTNTRKAKFVIWYCTPEDEREDFKTFSRKFLNNVNYETVEEWLLEPEIAEAIKYYMKLQHTIKMKKIYDKMYEQALAGDVQSAKFLVDFSKEFLGTDNQNELEKLLNNLKVVDEDEEND